MKYLRLPFQHDTRAPMLALMFATTASVVFVLTRIAWTRDLHYGFLVWNLFLAWLPLLFALLARETFRTKQQKTWRLLGLAGAWFLFFPNAPYIFTDLIHLTARFPRFFWTDLTLILLCAFTGLMLGFVSLYFMQAIVARLFGRVAGWLFVALAVGLGSLGIYLGRFLRFNSWDVLLRPGKIYHGLDTWMDGPMINTASAAFLVFFAAFLFITYVMLHALTRLPKTDFIRTTPENG
jgi:uncharacterized membrane protein